MRQLDHWNRKGYHKGWWDINYVNPWRVSLPPSWQWVGELWTFAKRELSATLKENTAYRYDAAYPALVSKLSGRVSADIVVLGLHVDWCIFLRVSCAGQSTGRWILLPANVQQVGDLGACSRLPSKKVWSTLFSIRTIWGNQKLWFSISLRGTWCLFYASWYTSYLAESKQERTAIAYATAFLLLLHRCIRLLAIRFQVSCQRFSPRCWWLSQVPRTSFPKFCHTISTQVGFMFIFYQNAAEVSGSYLHANTLMSAKAMATCLSSGWFKARF